MANITMRGQDAIAAKMGECFITINGRRYNFMQVTNIEVRLEKSKVDVDILGSIMKSTKSVGMKGVGSAEFHYNTSIFRKAMKEYMDSGMDFYFDMQLTNNDPSSAAEDQTVIIKNCNVDSTIISLLGAGDEILQDKFDFTFDNWEIPKEFKVLQGML